MNETPAVISRQPIQKPRTRQFLLRHRVRDKTKSRSSNTDSNSLPKRKRRRRIKPSTSATKLIIQIRDLSNKNGKLAVALNETRLERAELIDAVNLLNDQKVALMAELGLLRSEFKSLVETAVKKIIQPVKNNVTEVLNQMMDMSSSLGSSLKSVSHEYVLSTIRDQCDVLFYDNHNDDTAAAEVNDSVNNTMSSVNDEGRDHVTHVNTPLNQTRGSQNVDTEVMFNDCELNEEPSITEFDDNRNDVEDGVDTNLPDHPTAHSSRPSSFNRDPNRLSTLYELENESRSSISMLEITSLNETSSVKGLSRRSKSSRHHKSSLVANKTTKTDETGAETCPSSKDTTVENTYKDDENKDISSLNSKSLDIISRQEVTPNSSYESPFTSDFLFGEDEGPSWMFEDLTDSERRRINIGRRSRESSNKKKRSSRRNADCFIRKTGGGGVSTAFDVDLNRHSSSLICVASSCVENGVESGATSSSFSSDNSLTYLNANKPISELDKDRKRKSSKISFRARTSRCSKRLNLSQQDATEEFQTPTTLNESYSGDCENKENHEETFQSSSHLSITSSAHEKSPTQRTCSILTSDSKKCEIVSSSNHDDGTSKLVSKKRKTRCQNKTLESNVSTTLSESSTLNISPCFDPSSKEKKQRTKRNVSAVKLTDSTNIIDDIETGGDSTLKHLNDEMTQKRNTVVEHQEMERVEDGSSSGDEITRPSRRAKLCASQNLKEKSIKAKMRRGA